MSNEFSIGDMARRSGCKVQTVRYYEQIGLLPEPTRTSGGQRRYSGTDMARLTFIRHGRGLGFSIDQIRDLLSLSVVGEDESCERIDRIARENLESVERRIAQLEGLRAELRRMIDACAGGRVAECRIIEGVGDHGLCLHERHDA